MKKIRTGITILLLSAFMINGCNQIRKEKFQTTEAAFDYYVTQMIDAKFSGDSKAMTDLWHPIQWEVVRIMHPDKSNDNDILQLIDEKINSQSLKKSNQELNMKGGLERVLNMLTYENLNIYVANYVFAGHANYDIVWYNYFVIGISDTANFDWKFIEFDEEFVDPIMGKIAALTSEEIASKILTTVSQRIVFDGKVAQYKPLGTQEQNMIKYFNKYISSFMEGNHDKVFDYLNPKILEYIVESDPSLSISQAKEVMKEQLINVLADKFNSKIFKIQIDSLLRKETVGNDIIAKLKYSLINDKDNIYQSVGSTLIAVSKNNGQSWVFSEYDPELLNIILSDYPQGLIQRFIAQ